MSSSRFPWQPDANSSSATIASLAFGGDLGIYSAGFRDGAETLLKSLQRSRYGQDMLVYPIVYSLRHAVELALKQVIWAGRRLIDVADDFPDDHDLGRLWAVCRPILQKIWTRSDDDSFTQVEATIRKLCAIDPIGEGFRYPVSTKKQGRTASIHPNLEELDLKKMFEDVSETLSLLDGADSGIDFYLEMKADTLSEARQYERELRDEFEAEMRSEYGEEQ